MNNIKALKVGVCDFCDSLKVNKTYFIYRIGFSTNIDEYNLGILKFSKNLADYLMKRGVHLSATQVILMRPDIVLQYLKEKYDNAKEKVLSFYLKDAEICHKCFEEYKKEIPEK
jgi:hypothetical protein